MGVGDNVCFTLSLTSNKGYNMRAITKYELIQALMQGGSVKEAGISVLCGVEREDGSGSSFNVKGYNPQGELITRHIRTID